MTFRIFCFLLAGLCVASSAPAADPAAVYFEQTATASVDGKARPTAKSRVYWRGNKIRMESSDPFAPFAVILDLDLNRGFKLDTKSKTAEPIDMAALQTQSNLGFSMAGEVVDPPGGLRTSELPGSRVVAGMTCTGYRIRGRNVQLDVWISKAPRVSIDTFADFLEWSGAAQSLGDLLPELRKLPGFPLSTHSKMTTNGHVYETKANITVIKTDPLPASLFELPAGYTVQEAAEAEAPAAP
jgi:hypothetical protein